MTAVERPAQMRLMNQDSTCGVAEVTQASDRSTARKRVVIIGADFCPSSFPPALRIRFFAQHLPEFGWEPIIVTTDSKYYENPVDPENECLLPAGLEVIRTAALPARLTRKVGFGDLGLRSLWHHWRALSALCRQRRPDLIFIPVPPNPSIVLGRLLNARFGIPYVVDYIDPLASEYYWKLPRAQRPPKWPLVYGIVQVVEPFALRRVSHLVGVDKSYADEARQRCPWLSDDDVTGIPYGGEPGDFEYVRAHPRPGPNPIFDPNDGHVHMSYVGRGGTDMLPALRAVFQAVRLGLERAPEVFSRVRLHFVGTSYAAKPRYEVLPLAREMELEGVVDEHPARLPYLEAIRIMLNSHSLLAIGSESAHYTASKIFPYILAERPMLAVFHESSSVVKILSQTQAGEVVTFSQALPPQRHVAEISEHLEKIFRLPRNCKPATRWVEFEPYTTRAMAGRLAEVLDNAVRGRTVMERS